MSFFYRAHGAGTISLIRKKHQTSDSNGAKTRSNTVEEITSQSHIVVVGKLYMSAIVYTMLDRNLNKGM